MHYKIPYYGMNEENNKRIEMLETILNLTNVYFEMTKED